MRIYIVVESSLNVISFNLYINSLQVSHNLVQTTFSHSIKYKTFVINFPLCWKRQRFLCITQNRLWDYCTKNRQIFIYWAVSSTTLMYHRGSKSLRLGHRRKFNTELLSAFNSVQGLRRPRPLRRKRLITLWYFERFLDLIPLLQLPTVALSPIWSSTSPMARKLKPGKFPHVYKSCMQSFVSN